MSELSNYLLLLLLTVPTSTTPFCSLHASDVPDDDNDDSRLSHGVVLAIMDAPLDGPNAVDRDSDEGEDRRERHAVVEEDPKAAPDLIANKSC